MADEPVDAGPLATRRRRPNAKADLLVAAAHRLVLAHGENFTTQDLIREADVGLQTLYRNFGGKDRLLVAVMADLIEAQCTLLAERASRHSDPVERLRTIVTETITLLAEHPEGVVAARFLASQRWRLHQTMPAEVEAAVQPYTDLLEREIAHAQQLGTVVGSSARADATLIARLVMATFHQRLYEERSDTGTADDVWRFCRRALGVHQ